MMLYLIEQVLVLIKRHIVQEEGSDMASVSAGASSVPDDLTFPV
jgi:hypothetical protein